MNNLLTYFLTYLLTVSEGTRGQPKSVTDGLSVKKKGNLIVKRERTFGILVEKVIQ